MIDTWWGLALVAIGVALVAMLLTAYAARRAGRVSVIDVTWGLALSAVAVVAAVVGTGTPWRRWVLAVLVVVWGARLSRHIFTRAQGQGEDPRYAELLGGGGVSAAVKRVYVPQGLAICLLALPIMTSAHWDVAAPWLVWVGVVVWAAGTWCETVADAQLAAYKKDPDRGPVLDRGLWAWTRHPNYFGDASVWWGLWLAGAAATGWLPGLLTLPAPIAMSYFLAYATGARPLEQTMMKRPGYPEYAARTSMFFPLPPRR